MRHPAYVKPELVASAPNQVWSWDITKLKGPVPYLYYSLYVILDLFSRYVVGWMVRAQRRAPTWPSGLIEQTLREASACQRAAAHDSRRPRRAHAQQARRAVVLRPRHRGQPLAAAASSNDNPFSDGAPFRTVKYRPAFPKRFGALEDIFRAPCCPADLLAWYNDAHHHSGLSYLTPADVHYGRAPAILDLRHRTRRVAYAAHPERFVKSDHHAQKPCRPPYGSIRRRKRPASRMPQDRRPAPRTISRHGCASLPWPRHPLDRSSLHRVDGVESPHSKCLNQVAPFDHLSRRFALLRRHGYLLATVVVKPER